MWHLSKDYDKSPLLLFKEAMEIPLSALLECSVYKEESQQRENTPFTLTNETMVKWDLWLMTPRWTNGQKKKSQRFLQAHGPDIQLALALKENN